MKTIKASNSEELIQVDDEDYEYLSRFKWSLNNRGYAAASLKDGGDPVFMHRLLMEAKIGEQVHHKDENRTNNQKSNLQITNQSEHSRTFPVQRNNSSGHRGVSFDKSRNKWIWYIEKNGRRFQGRCETKEDATTTRQLHQ